MVSAALVVAADLARLLIDDAELRARALRAPGSVVAEWCLNASVLTDAGHRLNGLTDDDRIRREGRAALFSLLAATGEEPG
jgi:hypothetical protein